MTVCSFCHEDDILFNRECLSLISLYKYSPSSWWQWGNSIELCHWQLVLPKNFKRKWEKKCYRKQVPVNIKSDWPSAVEKEKWIMAPLWSFWNYICAYCICPPGSHDDNRGYLSAKKPSWFLSALHWLY